MGYIKNFDTYHDRALDSSGAVFIEALSRTPQDLDVLVSKIMEKFNSVDRAVITNDTRELYTQLEAEGLIVSGETIEEVNSKDLPFSYSAPRQEGIVQPGIFLKEKSGWALLVEELGGPPRLLEMQVEITNRCNERCVHCYIPGSLRKNGADCDIEPALFYKMLEECRKAGMLCLAISGGEAMLHRNFIDFLKKAKEYNFAITVFSNLTALNDAILAELCSPFMVLVKTSLYSINPSVHEAITGVPGPFQKTFDGIQKLIEHNIPVEINCPVMKQNQDSFQDVVSWGNAHNIEVRVDYNIYAPFDHSNSNLSCRCTLESMEQVIRQYLSVYRMAELYSRQY